MKIKIFLCLGIVSSLLLVQCSTNQNSAEYTAIDNATDSLLTVVYKYTIEFDEKVKFSVLVNIVDEIDSAMRAYVGTAKEKLDQVGQLNSAAELAYNQCVGPVFDWCVVINNTLETVLPALTDEHIAQEKINIHWTTIADVLALGANVTTTSLQLLDKVQSKVEHLREMFDGIRKEIQFDFGPLGKYGMRKEELNALDKSKRSKDGELIAALIKTIVITVTAIVTGNLGSLMGLPDIFAERGFLPTIIQKVEEVATYEEQLEIIEQIFVVLEEKIMYAKLVTQQVDAALNPNLQSIDALSKLIAIANEKKEVLLMNSAAERALLVSKLSAMKQKCSDYVYWHGYGSEGYSRKEQTP